uniref:Uncharacterized protein n=1 Tax=viral metagenome TaxID=1070528 RepID=A0A6C0DY96_9ZZZZ
MAVSPKYIHNRKLLYFLFFVAFIDFLYLVYTNDMSSVTFFIMIFIITTFFTKNMIIILFISFISTNVVKYGLINEYQEGFAEDEEENEEAYVNESAEVEEDASKLNVEGGGKKEGLKPIDSDDHTLEKTDKLILPEIEVLEKMNKYKPLLDTLSGLSKNMAAFS